MAGETSPPFIPGHEGVGVVDQIGEGVAAPVVGDRVAVPWLGSACGTCEYCITGGETLCEAQLNTGYAIDGGHPEYLIADARYVVKVPAGIAPAEAAPLTCAGVTTYKAIKVGGAAPGTGCDLRDHEPPGVRHTAVYAGRTRSGICPVSPLTRPTCGQTLQPSTG